MRVLITGSRGQVGCCLKDRLPEEWELIATDSKTLDITDATKVATMIASFQPDIIINTAAYTHVNDAEHNSDLAFAINATGVKNLAISAHKNGARLIHLSTDYVFDGKKQGEYHEEDYPNPINTYGHTKLAGELLALANCEHTLIIRTSSIFSEYGINFVSKIIEQAKTNNNINIATHGKARPTYAGDLADLIIDYIQNQPKLSGIVHFGGSEALTWFEFAKLIVDASGSSSVVSNNIDDNPSIKRPVNSTLQISQGISPNKTDLIEQIKHVIQ